MKEDATGWVMTPIHEDQLPLFRSIEAEARKINIVQDELNSAYAAGLGLLQTTNLYAKRESMTEELGEIAFEFFGERVKRIDREIEEDNEVFSFDLKHIGLKSADIRVVYDQLMEAYDSGADKKEITGIEMDLDSMIKELGWITFDYFSKRVKRVSKPDAT